MAALPPVKILALWLCRLLLGGTFAYAALNKIADPAAFATDITHYHLLPYALTLVFGLYLPWLELVCSAGVIFRWRERGALLLSALMCAIFCVAIGSAWFRGLDINCGCFGQSTSPSVLPLAFARSLALGLLALFLIRQTSGSTAAPAKNP